MKAIVVHQPGGLEALRYEDRNTPAAQAGEALVRLQAIGVNFIDIYHRTGFYKLPTPFVPGSEGAGVVEAVGEGVADFAPGDRVAYANVPGAYAEYAAVPVDKLVKIPDGVSAEQAAAAMLQGMTAHYLVYSTYAVRMGDAVLIHAAAGGVGLLLTQLAKHLGARVIGTTSTEEKAELARQAGADEIIFYTRRDVEEEVRRLTGGRGVAVVYDGVGRDTYMQSLNSLAPRGMLVLYGQASGPVDPINPLLLTQKGSLFLTRPSLAHYVATRQELEWRAGDILSWVKSGELRLHIEHTFPLAEAAQAHRELEGRKTTGKVLLIP